MKNNLGWTTIEQSKKLIKAGLDIETADMYYCTTTLTGKEYFDTPMCGKDDNSCPEEFTPSIPCWSLGRLIDLMPRTIETKKPKNIWFPEILSASNGVCYEGMDGDESKIIFLKIFSTGTDNDDNTLVDNVVNMICWLLENNYQEKGEEK